MYWPITATQSQGPSQTAIHDIVIKNMCHCPTWGNPNPGGCRCGPVARGVQPGLGEWAGFKVRSEVIGGTAAWARLEKMGRRPGGYGGEQHLPGNTVSY